MKLITILTFIFGSGAILAGIRYTAKKVIDLVEMITDLMVGVQALLRDRLYGEYDRYTSQGFAPNYAKENFANMYKHYHSLGANGVMDAKYKRFMELPDAPEKEEQ